MSDLKKNNDCAHADGAEISENRESDVAVLRRICQTIKPKGQKQQGYIRPGCGNFIGIPSLLPTNSVDQVFPRLFLGDQSLGCDPGRCKALGITHILNAAMGEKFGNVNTNESQFEPMGIRFHGIKANDNPGFDLFPYFDEAINFIFKALTVNDTNKVYVHCVQGISRSSTLVCAFLMRHHGMSAAEGLTHLREKRQVFPNDGFLRQLCRFEAQLRGKDVLSFSLK